MAALVPLRKTPLLLLVLSTFLGGCVQTFTYRELELPNKTFGEIWVGMQHVTRKMGYKAKTVDRGKKVFESGWRTQTRFPRGSIRHRLRAEVERLKLATPDDPDASGWRVRCYVEQQRVATVGRTLNPREEDWEPDGQNPSWEDTFVRHLRGELGLPTIEPPKQAADKEPPRIR